VIIIWPAAVDRNIDRDHGAACRTRRPIVDPAFDDEIEAGKADAGDQAEQGPELGLDQDGVADRNGSGDRDQRGKGAGMADAAEQDGRKQAADDEAEIVARAQQAQINGGEALDAAADRQQHELQPITGHQQRLADQQRRQKQVG
jgi:hypothetical protein